MGVFGRIRDIINSNINGALDKNEDPEKMINYIIREMEDALIDLRTSCANVMADKHRLQRSREEAVLQSRSWENRAQKSIDFGREDLAREALLEKRRYLSEIECLEEEIGKLEGIMAQYQEEMAQIADKLNSTRDKKRFLIQRHTHAAARKRSQEEIRRFETSDVLTRFENFADRLGQRNQDGDHTLHESNLPLTDEFARLEDEEWIERNLAALKARLN